MLIFAKGNTFALDLNVAKFYRKAVSYRRHEQSHVSEIPITLLDKNP